MLNKKHKQNIALVGATGIVGRELLELLEERAFPVGELVLLASEHSEGERIESFDRNWTVRRPAKDSFKDVSIAFFAAGTAQSLKYILVAVDAGALVIDSSGAFQADPNVPIVVPGVNAHAVINKAGIIASPNCITVGLATVMKPIHDAAKITRIVVTTFQSVSGDGKKAIDELAGQTVGLLNFKEVEKNVYPHQIAFNCIPHVGDFIENGDTSEEAGIADALGKIMGDGSIRITATAVHVPVFRGHSASINIATEKKVSPNEVRAVLSAMPGVIVYDDPGKNIYPLAIDVSGKDEMYAGRIREDGSLPNGINLWMAMDNVRGGALNMVQIAEQAIR